MSDGIVETAVPTVKVAGRALLVVGCAYEIVAIIVGRVPTITAVVHNVGRRGFGGRLVVWAIGGFVSFHFMEKLAE